MGNHSRFWLLLTTFLLNCILRTEPMKLEDPVDSDFEQKIVEFIHDHQMTGLFQRYGSRVVLLDETKTAKTMFEVLTKRLPVPTILLTTYGKVLNVDKKNSPSIIFIFIENEKKLESAIEHLQNSDLHQSNTPTVMVKLSQIVDRKRFDILSIMKSAWNRGLVRFLLIYRTRVTRALSYNPFENKIVNVSNKTGNALFPRYLKNMHKYRWRVSLFEEWPLIRKRAGTVQESDSWIGRDFTLLKEVAILMNATLTIVEPSANTSYKGAIRDILDGKVDFCFVRRIPEKINAKMRFINTGSLSSLSVIVRSLEHQEKSTVVLLVFRKEIWLLLLLTIIALMTTMKLLLKQTTNHYGIQTACLDIWKILLNISLHGQVRKKYTSVIPLAALIWSSLILSASFQSRLIDLIKNPPMKGGIQSLRDLEISKLPVYSSFDYVKMQGEKGYLRNQMNLVSYKKVLQELDDPISDSAVVMPFVVVRGKTSSEFQEYLSSRRKTILKESLVDGYAVYTFPYSSPFNNAVYVAVLRITEFGLRNRFLQSSPGGDNSMTGMKTSLSLSLEHVISAFHFICIGLILSILVLISEIMIGFNSKRKT